MSKITIIQLIPAKFNPGQMLMTPGAIQAFVDNHDSPFEYIRRHVTGDYGTVDASDKAANDWAILSGGRILSAYTLADEQRIWLITEADRSATTILLPEEY